MIIVIPSVRFKWWPAAIKANSVQKECNRFIPEKLFSLGIPYPVEVSYTVAFAAIRLVPDF